MSISEALAEAYASAPDDEIILETIELIHPAFRDDNNNPTSIRVVRAYEDYSLTLEVGAPLDSGQEVVFRGFDFGITVSGFEEGQIPSIALTISNVSRLVTTHIEQAVQETDPITVIYRPYLSSDTSAPQIDPVVKMTLTKISVKLMTISATATLNDVFNSPFPGIKYLPENFPGLQR